MRSRLGGSYWLERSANATPSPGKPIRTLDIDAVDARAASCVLTRHSPYGDASGRPSPGENPLEPIAEHTRFACTAVITAGNQR